MTMTDLEWRATDAVIKLRQEWGTQEPRDSDVQLVRVALKAHAEWLEEQGLVVSYDLLHEIDVTSAGLAELLRRGGKFVLPESHAESETAPNGPGHQKTP